MSEELERRVVVDLPMTVTCATCGRSDRLWFNGGELDAWTCCGVRHTLEHGDIFYVRRRLRTGDPPAS